MTATILDVVNEKKAEARTALITACWADATPEKLLELAIAADIEPDAADAIRADILRVKHLEPAASQVEVNRQAFGRAEQATAEAVRRAEKLEAEAEELRLNASYALEQARKAMFASDSAAAEILRVHDAKPDIVSREHLSKPMLNLLKKRQAARHEQAVTEAERQHGEAIRRAEREIEALRQELRNLPLGTDYTARERALKRRIEKAEQALKELRERGPEPVVGRRNDDGE